MLSYEELQSKYILIKFIKLNIIKPSMTINTSVHNVHITLNKYSCLSQYIAYNVQIFSIIIIVISYNFIKFRKTRKEIPTEKNFMTQQNGDG
jgi:hypothetical protein